MMTRNQISAFLGLSLLFWVIMLVWRGTPITPGMLLPFGSVVGAVSLSLLIFDRWVWHWAIFRGWLMKRPRVHGTWRTELQSDWIDPSTGKGIPPIDCYMSVRQTASTLSFRLFTKESRSETIAAAVELCRDGTFEISCTYRNRPRSEYRHRSEVHYGALLLVADTANPKRIEGEYWTDRKTTGTIVMTSRIENVCMTFEEAEKLFAQMAPRDFCHEPGTSKFIP